MKSLNNLKSTTMQKVRFNEWDCVLEYGTYNNKRIAIQLNDAEDGMPIAIATVNLPELSLPPDHVFIKSWSENEGMAEALIKANIIGPNLGSASTGFVAASMHKLIKQ
jgi:hypothetical protein